MKIKLRSNLYRSAVIAILSCGFATALVILVAGELLFRAAYVAARDSSFLEARSRFAIFDFFVTGADERMRGNAEGALRELGRRYPSAHSIAEATAEGLRADAKALGVAEVYLVRPDGHIGATSFEKDFGLDLFSFGEKTTAGLRSLFGAGRVAHHPPSQSAMTGIMGSYYYYSPLGSDILIEVSTSIRAAMDGIGSGGYDEFLDLVFGGAEAEAPGKGARSRSTESLAAPDPFSERSPLSGHRPLVRISDLVGLSGGTVWSFAREGRDRPELLHLVAVAQAKGTAREVRGDLETLVIQLSASGDGDEVAGERRCAVLELDLSPLWRFRLIAALSAVAACTISGSIAFYAAKLAIDRGVAQRMERLSRAAERIALGDYEAVIEEPGEDEISSIARAIAGLVRIIAERNTELKSSLREKEELLREVHHRVKNNLQVIASLVSLQMSEASGQEALRSLGATRMRIYSMAVVHDQLYRSDSFAAVDFGACLASIAEDVAQSKRRPGLDVAFRVAADGLALPADKALPACLAAAELIANCYAHAFVGRAAGRIDVAAGGGAKGGFWLSVEDDGVGAGSLPLREGLGLGIVRVLAAQLGGELRREPRSGGGERFVLDASLRERLASAT